MSSIDQQFIEYIVKSLVSKPDAVKVERRIDEKGVLLELTVDPEDLGRVIGKRGGTAQSLRILLRALGTKNDARYNLKIVDNGVPRPDRVRREDDHQPREQAPVQQAPTTDQNDVDAPAVAEADEVEPPAQEDTGAAEPEKEDVVSKTRRELDELDDLDI